MKRFVWLILAVGLMSVPAPAGALSFTMRDRVYFASGSAELDDAAKRVLDKVSKVMTDSSPTESGLIIYGHTDRKEVPGDREALALGKKRAQVVKDYLASKGLEHERIKTWSFGWSRPTNPSSDNPPKNRRAVILHNEYTGFCEHLKERLEERLRKGPPIRGCK